MRCCTRCGQSKDEVEFALNRYGAKSYRRRTCRDCYSAARANLEADDKPVGLACNKCHQYKPVVEFPKHRGCLYGIEPVCKACKHRRRREFAVQFPERVRQRDLKANYGLTFERYAEMVREQRGQCAICGQTAAKLVVDHNHTTGQVRGLLCHLCNAMIGYARERIEILAQAAAYLHAEAHPEAGTVRAAIAFAAAPS